MTLQRFGRFCNDCYVREVTAAQVAAFVHETPHSPTTKRHWRRDLNTAFKWFLKQQWTDVNPVDAVLVPKIILPEPGILKVEEAEALFARAGLLVSKAAVKASKGKLQTKAPPKNCLRHSFVSYHVALHRDPGKTALLVSHKDQAVLWDHYLGVATAADAGRYFGIQPLRGR